MAEGQGLVKLESSPVKSLPAYPVEDGCYRQDADHPERLSPDEEAAVWARIENNNGDDYNSVSN